MSITAIIAIFDGFGMLIKFLAPRSIDEVIRDTGCYAASPDDVGGDSEGAICSFDVN